MVFPTGCRGLSAELFSHYTKNFKLNHFVITVAKTATYHYISHESFSIHK